MPCHAMPYHAGRWIGQGRRDFRTEGIYRLPLSRADADRAFGICFLLISGDKCGLMLTALRAAPNIIEPSGISEKQKQAGGQAGRGGTTAGRQAEEARRRAGRQRRHDGGQVPRAEAGRLDADQKQIGGRQAARRAGKQQG